MQLIRRNLKYLIGIRGRPTEMVGRNPKGGESFHRAIGPESGLILLSIGIVGEPLWIRD